MTEIYELGCEACGDETEPGARVCNDCLTWIAANHPEVTAHEHVTETHIHSVVRHWERCEAAKGVPLFPEHIDAA